ncbi:MAG: YkgJ family cysteine cluster protein [Gemmataceae bacterium]|nr:YkgJ family cysteine cluster protein [Gemmataceae bacterium]
MPLPVRHLPVIQNWDCHECGQCCREYTIHVTDAERQRIADQGWAKRPEFADTPLVVRDGFLSDRWRLNHRQDGGCVFLNEAGRCRIHIEFGGTQKPLACQVYPYVLNPVGDHWRVGVRFACPSATANKGRPITDQKIEIANYAHQLEEREGVRGRSIRPPRSRGWQRLTWENIEQLTKRLSRIIATPGRPLEIRWRHALALAAVCRQSRLNRLDGQRLGEFADLMVEAVSDVPASVPVPSTTGRILFRMTAALYCRRDTGAKRGMFQKNRIRLLRAAARFARGTGPVPPIHAWMPAVSFEELESPLGPISAADDELLTRYYQTKIESFQFFGPIHYHDRYWDGFESLALTFPVTMWLARAFVLQGSTNAIEKALQVTDDSFGYNPLLGTRRQKWITRLMAGRDDLSRLVTWYGR